MKKAFLIILCCLVISGFFLSIFDTQINKNIKKSYIDEKNNIYYFGEKINESNRLNQEVIPLSSYGAEDITPKDAAYHRSQNNFLEEWWYFDAIFDNGYSAVISVVILSRGFYGIVSTGMDIYINTKLEFHLGKKYFFKEFEGSEDFPLINVSGKQILKFDKIRFDKTGEWVYNISLNIEGQKVNLQFVGTTKGYKGKVLRGWYGPVLPKATVQGHLIIKGNKINVTGLGYHEHAWEISHPITEYGWFWGKASSKSYTLAWATLMKNRFKEKTRVAVFSQDNAGYIEIDTEKINFKATKYILDHWRLIPTKFILNITDPANSIYINISMESVNTHHYGKFIFRYWRYHLRVNGKINYKSNTEIIENQIQTMEYMKFR